MARAVTDSYRIITMYEISTPKGQLIYKCHQRKLTLRGCMALNYCCNKIFFWTLGAQGH